MLRIRHSVLAGCALTVAALAFPATMAAAQPATSPQEPAAAQPAPQPPPGVAEAMQRDLGLSAEQARTRLANEQRAGQTEASLRSRLSGSFGGSWLNGPTATLVVATTDANAVPAIVATGAEATVVQHSLTALDAAKEALDRAAAKAPRTAPVWYVDVRTNSVVVLASQPAKAEAFVAASGADRSLVHVEKSAEQPRPFYDLRGGDAYYIGSGTRCSIGFPVTRGATQGFVTAGHCAVASSTSGSNGVALGTFQGSSFPGQRLRLGRGQRQLDRAAVGVQQRGQPLRTRRERGDRGRVRLPLRLDHRLALRHRPAAQQQRHLPGRHRLRGDPHQRVRRARRLRRLLHLR
ncbi:alpha-lytic protease prodomain-containing protein [Microtetraspora malaysiensis]|uniref:Alpha-lytic protease prodomain-containing protein n=1 Tax=Microtetraspora malaysiensis TaxID=161358 RepID=A0ABW6STM5_9ACTN